ncbi:hypothetical protein K7472_11285 [Streptomyces sp. PTM05]|uniref:Uncharacterized protein n=1 Tax=Streptantibioticus parmotrematis TaxID=2873249 RepID=A0ABS7QQH9_9ACTN|nr:hypothetical protein [Streptantibioticus parmotrematis]MBY8885430.1 hypothetical protein [Streptantibioticus parmotrematis]
MPLTAADAARVHRRRVGPRRPGAVYQDTRGVPYRVDAVLYGPAARAALGHPMSWAVTVTGPDGRQRTHCTPWDPRRERPRPDLCPVCLGVRHRPGPRCPADSAARPPSQVG